MSQHFYGPEDVEDWDLKFEDPDEEKQMDSKENQEEEAKSKLPSATVTSAA